MVQQQFRSIIRRFFEPVSKLINETRNIYFHRHQGSHTKSLDESNFFEYGGDSKVKELIRILEVSDTPLFIKTDCSFKKLNLGHAESTYLPILDLPSSYRFYGELTVELKEGPISTAESSDSEVDDPFALDFTPHIIGTDGSPIESMDGTVATLHILCLSLPRARGADGEDEHPTES
jgi:hypothetical protein